MYKLSFVFLMLWANLLIGSKAIGSIDTASYISRQNLPGSFSLSSNGLSTPLLISSASDAGVIRALQNLRTDIGKVTGLVPNLTFDTIPASQTVVVVGTLGKSPVIDKLVREGKLDVSSITGQWESFMLQVVDNPFAGTSKALFIVGSDKRGTIYGVYDLSTQIGVSPWYWWADVPVQHQTNLFVKAGKYIQGAPSVKYRGIFLNDEKPNLTYWVAEKFGKVKVSSNPPIPARIANYNHEFYERVFELILRLKGNYLWPAMWDNAFNEDDPDNARLADEYGIVMGTSHQEPMLRAQKEWDRRYLKTLGTWNYSKNPTELENFWRDGVRRNKNYESILTIGLRGANDTEMAPGGPEANKALLETIVNRQRSIIAEEINPDVTKVPQVWCLYKEVQEFYQSGMRVPDDVTLLWAEDNWGNLRRLPTTDENRRAGGSGIYYHFDYHGSPRNYQWMNSSPLAKICDQMSLAKQYGADRVWIVNVGHLRGYELPLEYFMDLAWKTDRWTGNNIDEYTRLWAQREFGETYASDIAHLVTQYSIYNGRRKPEQLEPATYSLIHYREAETVVSDYNALVTNAEALNVKLPAEMRDAFYQLVLFPIKASALVNELYLAAAKNHLYAKQQRASANSYADETRRLFAADTSLMYYYNHSYANGRWNHFMDQTHLGYTSWNEPPTNSLRAIKLEEVPVSAIASMGVSVEGSEAVWPGAAEVAALPAFDAFRRDKHFFEVFNKGGKPFRYKATTNKSYILISERKGTVTTDKRLWVDIDWSKAPKGKSEGIVKVQGATGEVAIKVFIVNPAEPTRNTLKGFVEGNGYVSMEAEHYTTKTDYGQYLWTRIERYGHTLSGMRANASADAPDILPTAGTACLEYQMYLFDTAKVDVHAIFGPVMNFMPNRAIRYAVSLDNETPKIISLVPANYLVTNQNADWSKVVSNNARSGHSAHVISAPGYHTIKIWMVSPGVVLQKIVVNLGGVKPSYLGPPESFFVKPSF